MDNQPAVQPQLGSGEGASAASTASPQPSTSDWRASIPEDIRNEPSLKDFKDVGGLAKSYVHAQRLIGAEGRVPPRDAPPDQWAKFYNSLGRPETSEGYTLPAPPEGVEHDAEFLAGFRSKAHELGLTNSQAARLAEWFDQSTADTLGAIEANMEAERQATLSTLRRDPQIGGAALDDNIRLANQFAGKFGGKELQSWLEQGEGNNPVVIKAFALAARAMSEDKLGHSRGSDFGYSPQEAQAEIGRLAMDAEFQKALYDRDHPAHGPAVERKAKLFQAAYPTEET